MPAQKGVKLYGISNYFHIKMIKIIQILQLN